MDKNTALAIMEHNLTTTESTQEEKSLLLLYKNFIERLENAQYYYFDKNIARGYDLDTLLSLLYKFDFEAILFCLNKFKIFDKNVIYWYKMDKSDSKKHSAEFDITFESDDNVEELLKVISQIKFEE